MLKTCGTQGLCACCTTPLGVAAIGTFPTNAAYEYNGIRKGSDSWIRHGGDKSPAYYGGF